MSDGPIESFDALLRIALGDRLAPGDGGFLGMLADDAVMEFPYAPPGLPRRLHGRAAIADYLGRLSKLLAFGDMGRPTVHDTAEPQTTIFEFEAHGHGVATQAPYDQRYISVVRTAGGRIVHYRDYWNPLVILAALNGLGVMEAATVHGMIDG